MRNGEKLSVLSVHVGAIVGTSAEFLCKTVREGSDLAKNLLLQALMKIHQSKPLRVNMKKLMEL